MLNKEAPLSVIIPLYNKEDTIEACVRSVLRQTLRPKRIIVVDDKSTDGSLAVLQSVISGDEGVELVTLPKNSGVSVARNTGASLANTEFIAFLDADDAWMPQFVEKMLSLLLSEKSNFAASCRLQIDTRAGASLQRSETISPQQLGNIDERFWSAFYPYLPVNSSCNIMRTSSFQEAGGFPTSMSNYEDFALWSRLWVRNRFSFCNEELAIIYKSSAGASAKAASSSDFFRLLGQLHSSLFHALSSKRPGSADLLYFIVRLSRSYVRSRMARIVRNYLPRK